MMQLLNRIPSSIDKRTLTTGVVFPHVEILKRPCNFHAMKVKLGSSREGGRVMLGVLQVTGCRFNDCRSC